MSDTQHHISEEPERGDVLFSARLTPYRSLPPSGFVIMMVLLGGTCFASGLFYMMIGLWPVMVFFLLDVALIYGAFKLNYRDGRAYEDIEICIDRVSVTRVMPSRKIQSLSLNPFWSRIQVVRDDEGDVTSIILSGEGKTMKIGAFLNPDDRTSFAEAFGHALARAKA